MRRSIRHRLTHSVLSASADLSAVQGRAVLYLARVAGIRQFLDIGASMPATVRAHELAGMTSPESRIFYAVDSPAGLAPALSSQPPYGSAALDYVTADPREPHLILAASTETLDYRQPVAVLLRGVLSYVADHEEAQAIAHNLMQAMASGSYLVFSDSTSLLQGDRKARQAQVGASAARLSSRIARLIDGLELIEPSQIRSSEESPGASLPETVEARTFCVVARKP
jgi:S-adenosyl methyltransferase